MPMMTVFSNFFLETFKRSSGRAMQPDGVPAIEDFYADDACSMCRSRTAPSSGTLHWTDSPENYVRLIRILSTHRTASRRPCMTGGFSRGARGRRARPPSTPGLTWWWFAKAKSLRYTSFSIRNCRSDSALLAAGLSPLGAGVRPQRAAWPRLICRGHIVEKVQMRLSAARAHVMIHRAWGTAVLRPATGLPRRPG